jgi:hypothetical protein
LEFRLYVAPQQDQPIPRIAYQVSWKGKPLIERSFLGLEIWDQEPLLGESAGLISSSRDSHANYNSLTARFMQNGSLGRLLNIEVRAYDDGIAFRYIIPRSTPLEELLIADEATEFALTKPATPSAYLPFIVGPLSITEVRGSGFPPMHLANSEPSVMVTRLARLPGDPKIAFQGTTPLTCPWRVVIVGAGPEILNDLK